MSAPTNTDEAIDLQAAVDAAIFDSVRLRKEREERQQEVLETLTNGGGGFHNRPYDNLTLMMEVLVDELTLLERTTWEDGSVDDVDPTQLIKALLTKAKLAKKHSVLFRDEGDTRKHGEVAK